jgi:hypothetical protein
MYHQAYVIVAIASIVSARFASAGCVAKAWRLVPRANDDFFKETAIVPARPMYLSVITIGEMRQGVEIIRHCGDQSQARVLRSIGLFLHADQRGQ